MYIITSQIITFILPSTVIIFNKRTHAFVKSMLRRVKYCCQGKRGKTRNCMTTVSTLNSLNSVISSPSKLDEEEDEEQPIPEEFDEGAHT